MSGHFHGEILSGETNGEEREGDGARETLHPGQRPKRRSWLHLPVSPPLHILCDRLDIRGNIIIIRGGSVDGNNSTDRGQSTWNVHRMHEGKPVFCSGQNG